jgi:hypothetical protein
MDYIQRIGMAAKILDLSGDKSKAVELLEQVVDDAAQDDSKAALLEALVFLAEVYWYSDEVEKAEEYVVQASGIDLEQVEPDLVEDPLQRLEELRQELDMAVL